MSNINRISKCKITIILFSIMLIVSISACKKKNTIPEETLIINNFLYDYTSSFYLWEDRIPSNIDLNNYPDPYFLFDDMIYKELDKWSFVTDNYQLILDALDGTEKTPGYQLAFYRYGTTDNVYAVTEYVYEGSPADIAGLKRGDLILTNYGQTLNIYNYKDILYGDQMLLGIGEMVDDQITDLGINVQITPIIMTVNPILHYDVIDTAGIKVGYLLYDQFIEDFSTQLEDAISNLQSQGITELVLDLRFNPGGYLSTCLSLASMITPASAAGEVFALFEWNQAVNQQFLLDEGPDSENLKLLFKSTDTNLNLERLFVLTSWKSASASEAIINGLRPYMDVTLIGDTTSGKYTGANFFYDENAVHNWGIYLVTSKVANKNGETDFINGFPPDFFIEDNHMIALGDPEEPLFSKAIELITGVPVKSEQYKFDQNEPLHYYSKKYLSNGILINDNIKK